jgi:hypothetical protein
VSEHDGTLGMRSGLHNESVYVYRDEGWRTCRWLVDPAGSVVDFMSLRYAATPAAARFVRGGAEAAAGEKPASPSWPSPVAPGTVAR